MLKHGNYPKEFAMATSDCVETLVTLLLFSPVVLQDTFIQALKQIPYLFETGKETTPKDKVLEYRNFPKFSDRQVWVNSAVPDQTAPRGAV